MAKAKGKASSQESVPRMPSEKQWRAENMMVEAMKKMPMFKAGVHKAMTGMAKVEKDMMKIMKGKVRA